MNPHIATPRQHGAVNFGSTSLGGSGRQEGLRMPRFFKRLFKFPQMDFEMAIWEMWSLLVAPKKVWRSVYYNHRTYNESVTFAFAGASLWHFHDRPARYC